MYNPNVKLAIVNITVLRLNDGIVVLERRIYPLYRNHSPSSQTPISKGVRHAVHYKYSMEPNQTDSCIEKTRGKKLIFKLVHLSHVPFDSL